MRKAQLGAFLSKESQQAQEQELQQENQNLQILQQQLSTQLQSELQQLDAQATDTIMHHLSLFNKKAQYNLILNSATLLDKGSAKDITDSILNILNQEYKKQKNAKK
jgi:Skp family chaperone for outer membrane proteins